jgi:adenylyltransferase/sulfurtransferase
MILPQIGAAGQERLGAANVVLIGCGALGTTLAEQLVRGGVGRLRIIDRDVVEWTNLQRQVLFDEEDARQETPKAVAAANRLKKINGDVSVEPVVADLRGENAETLLDFDSRRAFSFTHRPPPQPSPGVPGEGVSASLDLILDGTDNAETRYLINDLAVKHRIPWIYCASVGNEGRMATIRPGIGPCLRCLFPEPPLPGSLPTCETSGVLGAAAAAIGAMAAAAAIQFLAGADVPILRRLLSIDLHTGRLHATALDGPNPECPACGKGIFAFLDRPNKPAAGLCGRDAVQVYAPTSEPRMDLSKIAAKLSPVGEVELTPYLLRFQVEGPLRLTLFADGRLIVHGTQDIERARSIYARYIGV